MELCAAANGIKMTKKAISTTAMYIRTSQTGSQFQFASTCSTMVHSAESISEFIRTSEFVRTVTARVSRRRAARDQETYSRMNDPIISKAYSTMGNLPNPNQPSEAKESTSSTKTNSVIHQFRQIAW